MEATTQDTESTDTAASTTAPRAARPTNVMSPVAAKISDAVNQLEFELGKLQVLAERAPAPVARDLRQSCAEIARNLAVVEECAEMVDDSGEEFERLLTNSPQSAQDKYEHGTR